MNARHLLARSLSVPYGMGCNCVICGESPFEDAGPASRVIGPNFTAYALFWGQSDRACSGCQRLMGGRPGDDPPPLRTVSVYADETGLETLKTRGLWSYLIEPRVVDHVLSWSIGRQVHHWLYAETSNAHELRVGSDTALIVYRPDRDRCLLDAVHEMLWSPTGTSPVLSRKAIIAGEYHPKSVATFGHAAWQRLEAVVAPYRPSPLLELACAAAPLYERDADESNGAVVLDPSDAVAGELLYLACAGSGVRANDGKMFWAGFFRHRIERFKRLALPEMMSRLMDACDVTPTAETTHELLGKLCTIPADEQGRVERSVRERTALVVSLAYDLIQMRRKTK